MQAGRLVQLQLEAETAEEPAPDLGLAPAVTGLAAKIQAALRRRENRRAAKTCAAIAPRDGRGRFV